MTCYTLFVFLLTSTAFADQRSSIYLLTSGDADSLASGFQYALAKSPDNQAFDWNNPVTGLAGSTVPIRSYRTSYGQVCRDYMSSVQLDGAMQQAFGTACRQADGNWKISVEKPVQRAQRTMKFVYVKQQPQQVAQQCPFTSAHPQAQQTYKQQYRSKQFHSDRFHEKFRTFKRGGQPAPEKRQVEPEQPSKLLKLVAY